MDERILNRYRLIERLAVGGSAEVWRAHDEQLDRAVAVKRLHAHLLPDEASRKRLAAEARAAAGLSHPVIVGVYDVDAEGDAPALVMELVDGESLADRIQRDGPFPPGEAARLVADLADALFHAHQQGVIHRDVKPGNVLLGRDGRVHLVDFGIAHSLADAAQRLTQTGTVVGTLRSMAPEQLAGGPITPRTDLYGLGVVLYEALDGRPPYPSATPLALAEAQRDGPPPIDGLDSDLAAILSACLAYDPHDRPLHAGALAEALRGWASGAATTLSTAASAGAASAAAAAAGPAAGGAGAVGAAPGALASASRDEAATQTAAAPAVGPSSGPPAESGPRPARRRRSAGLGWVPLAAAAAAAVLLVAWLVLGGPDAFDAGGVADTSPSPTPTPSPAATPTPLPEWATELAAEVAEVCDADTVTAAELAAMGEDDADDHADELIEACEEAAEDRGNGGNSGRGRGGGNNGNDGNSGRGNDN